MSFTIISMQSTDLPQVPSIVGEAEIFLISLTCKLNTCWTVIFFTTYGQLKMVLTALSMVLIFCQNCIHVNGNLKTAIFISLFHITETFVNINLYLSLLSLPFFFLFRLYHQSIISSIFIIGFVSMIIKLLAAPFDLNRGFDLSRQLSNMKPT